MKAHLLLFIILSALRTQAQIGIGTSTPNQKAILDIVDSSKGLLIPRMSITNREGILNPPQGLMVYQIDSTKGFWYFDGTWKNINSSSNNGGKHTLILSDTITNSQAAIKIAADFGPNTQEIRIQGCLYLTSVDLSMFNNASGVTITDNPVLQDINLQNLKICDGYFSLNNCPALTHINLNSLESILYNSSFNPVALFIKNAGFLNLTFPKLRRVLGTIAILENSSLASISFPVLSQEVSFVDIERNTLLANISFPLLPAVGLIQAFTNNSLSTISLPMLSRFTYKDLNYNTWIQDAPNLTLISLGNLTEFRNGGFVTSNTKLSTLVVNSLLSKFASITPPITGRTIDLRQNSPAPPTGQGLIDKQTLSANGNTVYTN